MGGIKKKPDRYVKPEDINPANLERNDQVFQENLQMLLSEIEALKARIAVLESYHSGE